MNLVAVQHCKLPWECYCTHGTQGQSETHEGCAVRCRQGFRCVCAPNALIAAAISIRPRLREPKCEEQVWSSFRVGAGALFCVASRSPTVGPSHAPLTGAGIRGAEAKKVVRDADRSHVDGRGLP